VRTLSRAAADNPYAKVKVTDEGAIARRLELISRKIPDCIISDPGLEPFVADYYRRVHFIPPALDLSDYPFRAGPNSDKPLVVHAPTAPGIKGTEAVRAAVKSLRRETDFDFHLIQNMPHAKAVKKMAEADLVVDQLHLGSHGTVAIEAMALGKAVVSWVSDNVREKYPADLPVISANPDTLQDVLRDLLGEPDRLVELGRRGREYVEKHHDIESLAPRYLELYRSL
jgi:glycosyltransferase involved in cell wall biosynthesis